MLLVTKGRSRAAHNGKSGPNLATERVGTSPSNPAGRRSQRSGSWRFMPDQRELSLAFDDLGFMPELGDHVVSSAARFPVMMATENLVGAAQVHGAAFQQRRTNITAVASLCRCAVEASANTIWLLAGTSREERRARCLGFMQSERLPQQGLIQVKEQAFVKRNVRRRCAPEYKNFLRHRIEHDDRQKLIAAVPKVRTKEAAVELFGHRGLVREMD